MEIKNDNKFKQIMKKYGGVTLGAVFCLALTLAIALSVPVKSEMVSTSEKISFGLPMNNATVVKDFSDKKLQFNESLNRWEIHLAVDMVSDNLEVFSVADGVVVSVSENSLEGTKVVIKHSDGFESVYSSLSKDNVVKEGEKISKGQKIGKVASSAGNESLSGEHLHFMLIKDGKEVNPNSYLDLQMK